MNNKHYHFKLPTVKEIKLSETERPANWLESQSMPVYAYIPACDNSDSMIVTELECKIE